MKLLTKKQVQELVKAFDGMNKKTRDTYFYAINDFLDYMQIELYQLPLVTANLLISYKKTLKEKYKSPATINNKITAIKRLFREVTIVLDNYINPFTKISEMMYLKIDSPLLRPDVLQSFEVKKLLEYLLENCNKRVYVFTKLILYTGLRISEAIGLQYSDISEREGSAIAMICGKGEKVREIEIPADIMDDLVFFGEKRDGYIFITKYGNIYDRSYISGEIKRACKVLFNRTISAHSLRHTFATHYYKKHGNIKDLSDQLGHASIDTTMKMYVHTKRKPTDDIYN